MSSKPTGVCIFNVIERRTGRSTAHAFLMILARLKTKSGEGVPTDMSRGWTPLKYPKSAILPTSSSINVSFFPLHNDVLLAAVRELLILDGIVDAKTLEISQDDAKSRLSSDVKTQDRVGRTKQTTVLSSTSSSSTMIRKQGFKCGRKRGRDEPNMDSHSVGPRAKTSRNGSIGNEDLKSRRRKLSAEAIAYSIIEKARVVGSEPSNTMSTLVFQEVDKQLTSNFGDEIGQRPRAVSEADQSSNYFPAPLHSRHYSSTDSSNVTADFVQSTDISQILDLKKKIRDGSFDLLDSRQLLSDMIHVSIADEEILREASRHTTRKLVESFSDSALRAFFGYKISGIDRERLVHLLAGLLFDVSHAMYAWEQTEKEILLSSKGSPGGPDSILDMPVDDVDDLVLHSLFGGSARAMKRVGGFEPSSLLPNAISIGRLRRRNTSWAYFASTVRGLRMLEYHKFEESRILVGKQRRGHRSRQRGLETSDLTPHRANKQENLSSIEASCVQSSSSASLTSEDEVKDDTVFEPSSVVTAPTNSIYTRLLEHVPGCLALSITRPDGVTSWGVGLLKEGDVCVVGRVGNDSTSSASKDARDNSLLCGDLILFAQNEDGKFACSPLCAASSCLIGGSDNVPRGKHEDWYRSLVDLFKNSYELQLLVQRVTS